MIEATSTPSAAQGPGVAVRRACPACGSSSLDSFFNLPAVPVHCNILWSTPAAAKAAPRRPLDLALCAGCGLIFNVSFDPEAVTYDESYENSLHYSPRFEQYASELARSLADRFALRNRLVVEVGCGKGDFLRQLCAVAGARGIGIDASYDPAIAPAAADDVVRFVREPFTTLPGELVPALVFCRHVIEHLPEPGPFVAELAAAARRSSRCAVFIEVPNALWTLRDLGIWDLIYEHCSYFSAVSLSKLCERAGLTVDCAYSTYGEQFLCLDAHAGPEAAEPGGRSVQAHEQVQELQRLTVRFSDEYKQKVRHWEARLADFQRRGRRAALWGAGSKGVTFVNAVPGGEGIQCLVDLNPRKQGRFVPGTGQPVVGPDALTSIRPDVVIIMNPLYRAEITELLNSLGVQADVELA